MKAPLVRQFICTMARLRKTPRHFLRPSLAWKNLFQKLSDIATKYPELQGIMGNNELMSLQFPRTFYFFNRAWDGEYKTRQQPEVLSELAGQLYPDHQKLIAESFLGLRETDPAKIQTTLDSLSKVIQGGDAGRPGALGRYLFPDRLIVARNLQLQLEIRAARQSFIKAMQSKPDIKVERAVGGELFRQIAGLEQRNRLGQDDRHHHLANPDL